MGVVEKSDGAEVAVEAEIEWGLVDNEIQLLQTLCQTSRPIGISKYFQMACIVEKLASNLNKEVTSKGVWDHLSTMYNLQKLEEQEPIPFPNEETDFTLSNEEFGELMESKNNSNKPVAKEQSQQEPEPPTTVASTSKKPSKTSKESAEHKKEKVSSTPPPPAAEKKAVKRTRASTTPSTSTETQKTTPKRRRI